MAWCLSQPAITWTETDWSSMGSYEIHMLALLFFKEKFVMSTKLWKPYIWYYSHISQKPTIEHMDERIRLNSKRL